uniref:Uncharacterized protein n=1 Tax=viral metagenome TaxID=1070528 RepID=A0A6C0DRS1_9ZZZZ
MKKVLLEKIKQEKIFSHDQQICDHEIVRDLIDVDPDRSQTIFYCEKCMADFTHLKLPKSIDK